MTSQHPQHAPILQPTRRPRPEQPTSTTQPAQPATPKLRLEPAEEKHRRDALEMKQEFLDAGETVINGSALFDQMDFDPWLANCQRNSRPETVRPDWAVATTSFAIRQDTGQIVGMVDLRHSLATDYLAQYGGHIGYSVRPSMRRRGFATQMLALALDQYRDLGMSSVRIGCYATNEASIRTIRANGGRLLEEKPYLDGKLMHVYGIEL